MGAFTVYAAVFGAGALAAGITASIALVRLGGRWDVRPRRSAFAWAAVFGALIAAVAAYAVIGRVEGGPVAYSVFQLACAAGLALQFAKGLAWGAWDRAVSSRRARLLAGAAAKGALLAAVAGLSFFALELPSNTDLLLAGGVSPAGIQVSLALIASVATAAFFLGQRTGAGPALVAAVCGGFGLAEHFVLLYKGQPITPGDLMAVGTAATVSGGYDYLLEAPCLYGLSCLVAALALCSLLGLRPPRARREEGRAVGAHFSASPSGPAGRPEASRRVRRAAGVAANLALGAALCAGLVLGVQRVDFVGDLGITISAWELQNTYRQQSFLAAFAANLQMVLPHEPRGYSDEAADALVEQYAAAWDERNAGDADRAAAEQQFSELKPTVIAIMNETFSDLSIFDGLGGCYTGPAYFSSISDALARGSLAVSAQGGGTANSEFEMLTGATTGFIGSGVYPYQSYNLDAAPSLARTFKELGYATSAMHPNLATNWNRENAYESLGFDAFYDIDDFAGAETLCGKVTDAATYDKILTLLAEDAGPQFIFDVTMQNHLPYLSGGVPEEARGNYVDWAVTDGESIPETNEYLDLIDASDRALEGFLGALSELDRPVVVLFFGDHQPAFSREYNDALFGGEDPLEHEARVWQTEYVIWANYDVAGNAQVSERLDTSANYLGALLLDLIGAPLDNGYKARLAVREELPAVSLVGYRDAEGVWHEHVARDASSGLDAYDNLRAMQHRMLFRPQDGGSNVLAVKTQDRANW